MEIINVLVAAAVAWGLGAAYYMSLAKPWTEAAGIEVDENGKPVDQSPLPFIISAIVMVLVAGMMRHVLVTSDVVGVGKGLVTGLGVGLFFISPWIFLNTGYGGRPFKLALIDSGYAVIACAAMGFVLNLF